MLISCGRTHLCSGQLYVSGSSFKKAQQQVFSSRVSLLLVILLFGLAPSARCCRRFHCGWLRFRPSKPSKQTLYLPFHWLHATPYFANAEKAAVSAATLQSCLHSSTLIKPVFPKTQQMFCPHTPLKARRIWHSCQCIPLLDSDGNRHSRRPWIYPQD